MMKRYFPWIVLVLAALWVAGNWYPEPTAPGDFDVSTFGKIPVLAGGRIKPFDTIARNSLLIIHERQTLVLEDGKKTLDASRWLVDVMFNPTVADQYPVFAIHNPEVLGLFGWQQNQRKYFSYAELTPFFKKIDEEGTRSGNLESGQRTPYETAIYNLRNSLILYQRLENSLRPMDSQDFASEITAYAKLAPEGMAAAAKREKKENFDKEKFDLFMQFSSGYQSMADSAYVLPIPPSKTDTGLHGEWRSMGDSLLSVGATGNIDPVTQAYALIGDAYREGNAPLFNQRVQDLSKWMSQHQAPATGRAAYEFLFNFLAPFFQSMGLYVLAFLLVCGGSFGFTERLNRAAFLVLLLGLAIHTFGLVSRMYLQERPPVTNLYSSAIFIGWGTVIIGLILEWIYRDGIGSICASVIGFITLIIAHHLAESGDTLEMLQAVLDTNIWLATHVVVITLGYSAMFLAGTLAIIYVMKGVFTRSLTRKSAQSLTRMTYGVICFAAMFSFVGTVLGGIWADQSWGRFWGWDPKENGALLIVLWCALILHARWDGLIRERGLMVMALFGNIITSFSWFGVNMLGVGLHSYGFMDKAFPWLVTFDISQLILILLAQLPQKMWKSFEAMSSSQHQGI